jgi:HSP20 family protein
MKITKHEEGGSPERFPADPFRGMFSLRDAMDRMFNESFWAPFSMIEPRGMRTLGKMTPQVDISETDSEVRVKANVPGIDPEKINVEVSDETISFSGEMEESKKEEGENFYRMERQYGSFAREFMLPAKVDPNSVDARSSKGVLTITLKKQEPEKKKKVSVKKED